MEKPELVAAKFVFCQEQNCCGSTEDPEELSISLEDGGGGLYVVIRTGTGWSASEPSDIVDLCQQCLDAANTFNRE